MPDRKRIFLIDGSALSYRSYFAFIRSPLINSKGENTSATYGFVNSLLKVLREQSPDYMAVAFDTMVASYLIDPDRPHGLNALSLAHLNHAMIPISDLIGKGKEEIGFAEVPVAQACAYSAEDADAVLRLKAVLAPKVAEAGAADLMRDVQMPLIGVLADMELTGVAVDVPFLREMSRQFERDLERLKEEIHRLAGEEFNINSPWRAGWAFRAGRRRRSSSGTSRPIQGYGPTWTGR
jgi:DNA polymerase-1